MQSLDRLEIFPSRIRNLGFLLGSAVCFGAGGVFLILRGGIVGVVMGIGCVLFFGVIGARATINSMGRRPPSLTLTREGIEVRTPDGVARWGLVPWCDVEAIGTVQGRMHSVGVRLSSYQGFLVPAASGGQQIPIREHRPLRLLTRLATAFSDSAPERYAKAATEYAKAATSEDYLRVARSNFGYELLFSWAIIDRPLGDFEQLLTEWWHRFQPESS